VKILIIGAGITGLTTALSLKAVGFSPVVYEAVANPAPLGVGINILPHAMREFTELGLLPKLRTAGVEIDSLRYLTRHGREIWREARGLAAGYRWPQIAIHRGRLQMILLDAVIDQLGPESVRFGHALCDVALHDDHVTASFVDRTTGQSIGAERGDVLLAADGIHSAVRQKFYPNEGRPIWNQITLWRSTVQAPRGDFGRAMLWAGHSRQKFVCYPIATSEPGEVLLNWICDLKGEGSETPAPEDWNKRGDPEALARAFDGWRWPNVDVPGIVRASREIFEFPMVDRDPLSRWTFGRVTLLGDAAHPMYPIGSNGATQGVIDARALAFHLATCPDPEAALARYEASRREATAKIVMMNRAQGPDRVMDIAEARAPRPDDDLDALFPWGERAEIAAEYKRVAGFDPQALNAQKSYSLI